MFTGIVETTGIITDILINGTNKTFWIKSPLSGELKVDQSLSHDGVCLTVEEIKDGQHRVTAVSETLSKTNINDWADGTTVNLERCLALNGRIDGHLVLGHTDTTGTVHQITENNGSWQYIIEYPDQFALLVIEKGSITINGISLTIFNISDNSIEVAIIPYTYEHTNLKHLKPGEKVNLEFDLIGKYVARIQQVRINK
ncbi:MAG: riboflavin synthase [Sphingobacteriales bacterium]|nr:riboflavin synthase [Sphingobacteriales bacterium]